MIDGFTDSVTGISIDQACGGLVVFGTVLMLMVYGARVLTRGRADFKRIEKDGGSALLGAGVLNGGYWALQPLGRACVALGLDANAVTTGSILLGAAAAWAMATGRFGVGALLAAMSFLADALDGLVARLRDEASDAGEVFDAVADRFVEVMVLGGVAVHYRANLVVLIAALGAIGGSFMVSYVSAKAEIARVDIPRGMMRRVERAVYLSGGAALTPLAPWPATMTPVIVATMAIAVLSNVSSVVRARALVRAIRKSPPAMDPIPCTAKHVEGTR